MNDRLGFQYCLDLSSAIEAFTYNAEANDPKAFEYKGSNLKYAVERHLYFSYVVNRRFYNLYSECLGENPPRAIRFASKTERDLFLYLCKKRLAPQQLRVRCFPRFDLGCAFRFIANLADKLTHLHIPALGNKHKDDAIRPDILICVIHQRFINYLRPVTNALISSFAYLNPMIPRLRKIFLEQGLPFVDASGLLEAFFMHRPQGILTRFRGVVFYYDIFYLNLLKLRPKCVMLVEGNSPQDEIINRACSRLSIPTVCLQHGWAPIIHSGFRNMSYTKMLVWGDGFSQLLREHNPSLKFFSVGSHVINNHRKAEASKLGIEDAITFFTQSLSNIILKEHWEDFLELIKWTASECPAVPILVRQHPCYSLSIKEKSNLKQHRNIILVPYDKYSLSDVLVSSRLAVSILSSVTVESIAQDVLPLLFNVTSVPSFYPDIQSAGAGIEVKSLESAKKVIKRVVLDKEYVQQFKPAMEKFRAQYFYRDGKKAVDRIQEEIASLITT